jgi:hypothetical protein
MDHSEQQEPQKRIVYAPQPDTTLSAPAVISIELAEDEDVEWQWTHLANGTSIITGYMIIKPAEQRQEQIAVCE